MPLVDCPQARNNHPETSNDSANCSSRKRKPGDASAARAILQTVSCGRCPEISSLDRDVAATQRAPINHSEYMPAARLTASVSTYNGGSAGAFHRPIGVGDPIMAVHLGGRSACLCIASARCECPLLPR